MTTHNRAFAFAITYIAIVALLASCGSENMIPGVGGDGGNSNNSSSNSPQLETNNATVNGGVDADGLRRAQNEADSGVNSGVFLTTSNPDECPPYVTVGSVLFGAIVTAQQVRAAQYCRACTETGGTYKSGESCDCDGNLTPNIAGECVAPNNTENSSCPSTLIDDNQIFCRTCATTGGTWNNNTDKCDCPNGTAANSISECVGTATIDSDAECRNKGYDEFVGGCRCLANRHYDEGDKTCVNNTAPAIENACAGEDARPANDNGAQFALAFKAMATGNVDPAACYCRPGRTWNANQHKCLPAGGGATAQDDEDPTCDNQDYGTQVRNKCEACTDWNFNKKVCEDEEDGPTAADTANDKNSEDSQCNNGRFHFGYNRCFSYGECCRYSSGSQAGMILESSGNFKQLGAVTGACVNKYC